MTKEEMHIWADSLSSLPTGVTGGSPNPWMSGEIKKLADSWRAEGVSEVREAMRPVITKLLGVKCETYDPDCITCEGWEEYEKALAEIPWRAAGRDKGDDL